MPPTGRNSSVPTFRSCPLNPLELPYLSPPEAVSLRQPPSHATSHLEEQHPDRDNLTSSPPVSLISSPPSQRQSQEHPSRVSFSNSMTIAVSAVPRQPQEKHPFLSVAAAPCHVNLRRSLSCHQQQPLSWAPQQHPLLAASAAPCPCRPPLAHVPSVAEFAE